MIETKAGEAPKILVVEDEIIVAKDIKNFLEKVGYTVTGIADSGELAIEKAALNQPNLVLMDIRLKRRSRRCASRSRNLESFQYSCSISDC